MNRREGTHLEYKEVRARVPSDLYESVCALLNKEGGTIFLGVDNDGNITGIEPDSIPQMMSDIITSSNNTDIIEPPFTLNPVETKINDGYIIYLKIPVSSQAHKHNGVIYDRENDSDLRIRDHERIGEIYRRKSNHFSEIEIYPALSMDDLDAELFSKAKKLIHSKNPTHIWLNEDDEGLLRLSNLYRRDFRTGDEGLTLASALIFGKDDVIQSILPAYRIEALVRKENMDRWDDRLPLRSNLIDSYQQLMDFIKKHLPEKFYLEGNQLKDLRELIFREIIANILIHREYTNATPTQLIIYKNSVETVNPNVPHFQGTIFQEGFHPYSKNPTISKFFTELGWAEELGSGIKNLFMYVPQYTTGAKPLLIEDDVFKSVIPLQINTLGERYPIFLPFLQIQEIDLPPELIAGLKKVTLSQTLADIEENDRLLFEMVSSWAEKGTKLYGKRFMTLMKIMVRSLVSVSLEELMAFMSYRNRASFRKLYIAPLLDNNLISRTIPERPSDPKQKYIVTDRGRYLLGGYDI